MGSKFKFCFLKFPGIFFKKYFWSTVGWLNRFGTHDYGGQTVLGFLFKKLWNPGVKHKAFAIRLWGSDPRSASHYPGSKPQVITASLPASVFYVLEYLKMTGESHGQRNLEGYSIGSHRVRHDWSNLALTPLLNTYEALRVCHVLITINLLLLL